MDHTADFASLAVKMIDGFRADQPAGSINQHCPRNHDRNSVCL